MTLFPILLEVEELSLGRVLRTLNGMPGVAKLHLNLDNVPKKAGRQAGSGSTPKPVPEPNRKSRAEGGPRAKDILITALMSGPKPFDELRQQIEAHGFSGGGTHPLIGSLRESGIVENAERGVYRLTEAAMAQLKQTDTATSNGAVHQLPPPAKKGRVSPGTGPAFIAAQIREHGGSATATQLREAAAQIGMSEKGVSGAISRMKRDKFLTAIRAGVYQLTAKGNKTLAAPEQTPKPNGEDYVNG